MVETIKSQFGNQIFSGLSGFLFLPLLLFPWLPPLDGRTTLLPLVVASGLLVTSLSLYRKRIPTLLSAFPLLSSLCVLATSHLPDLYLVQMISWVLLLSAIPLALCTPAVPKERSPAIFIALTSMYLLLSLSYEALLIPTMVLALEAWLLKEQRQLQEEKEELTHHLDNHQKKSKVEETKLLNCSDVGCIISFVFLIFYSFFATGNIASLNSFDPSSIRALVAVFNPFLMGGLLLMKILLPFLVVSVAFVQLLSLRNLDISSISGVLQLSSDCLGLVFFSKVTHTGSWLEIGTSLSHFVIVEGSVLAITLLLQLAKALHLMVL